MLFRVEPFGDPRVGIDPSGNASPSDPIPFYITNHATRGILAIVVLRRAEGARARCALGTFLSSNPAPIIRPRARKHIVTTLPILSRPFRDSEDALAFEGTPAEIILRRHGSPTVDVWVDCVVFDNGEVVGPDTTGYLGELRDRRTTAATVMTRFREAQAAGAALADVFAEFKNDRVHPASLARWKDRFARWVTMSPWPQSVIQSLDHIAVSGPVLFNTTTGEKQ
jgi:hypothetical protein